MQLISIIVPIYNVEKYVQKCIESIADQSYKDIEIILVDDGSTDDCKKICDRWAKVDKRIKVIHKKNGGLVSARKEGLKHARGQYVCYVDGDDWIEKDWIESLWRGFDSAEIDMVCAYYKEDYCGWTKTRDNQFCGMYSLSEIKENLYHNVSPFLWSKMFKADMLRRFQNTVDNEIGIAEDAAVVYPLVLNCRKVCFTSSSGYHYVQRTDSMMNTYKYDEDKKVNIVLNYLEKAIPEERDKKWFFDYCEMVMGTRVPQENEVCETKIEGKKLVLYGAGAFGRTLYQMFSKKNTICKWLDKESFLYQKIGMEVENPDDIDFTSLDFDAIVIGVWDKKVSALIAKDLRNRGIKKVIYGRFDEL